ncbi:MAG TPA: PAS domain S-box protein, partial [Chitinophagaceae bacterium]|nr:PAS domain S-box protein [Chitinophagaceae bacterium]
MAYSSLFFDNNPLPCFIVNAASLQIINANKASCIFYEYSLTELITSSFLDLYTAPNKLELFRHFKRPCNGEVFKEEVKHLKKNGDVVTVEIYITLLKIDSKPVYQIAIVDITDKIRVQENLIACQEGLKAFTQDTKKELTGIRESEKDLLESEARKSAILESSLDAIITIDISDSVIEWNLAAERIFGYSREEAIGEKMANLIIPERYREHHLRGINHFLKT